MTKERALTPVERLKNILSKDSVKEQFTNALAENSNLFIASLIDIYATGGKALQACDPKGLVMEALKAATLRLPINRNLGFAWIVPYKGQAQMQIGYKGYLQLAQRTGQYKYINADVVYEGELLYADKLTGEVDLSGEKVSNKVVGYFAHVETITGFKKTLYWTKEKVTEHAKKYSAGYNSKKQSPWDTDFDAMAVKTLLRALFARYGIMSVDMAAALNTDAEQYETPQDEIDANANGDIIDIDNLEDYGERLTDEEKAEIEAEERDQAEAEMAGEQGPDFGMDV